MSLLTLEGRFKDGKINLTESPPGIDEALVLVTFLPPPVAPRASRPIEYGMFRGPKMTTEEDFSIAEWRGESEEKGGK